MQQYLLKRVLLVVPTLLGITLIVFALTRLIPGDVVQILFQEHGYARDMHTMRMRLGLDRPVFVQYLHWLAQVLQGDLGTSLWTRRAVSAEIWYRLPITLELGGLAWLLAVLLAIPVGILSAIRHNTMLDYLARSLAVGGLSIPGFWLATIAIVLPAYYWGWTPPIQFTTWAADPWRHGLQFLLPASLLGLASAASLMRLTRGMLLDVLPQEYIRTAWAKGGTSRLVLGKHALRNALMPVLTVGGMQLGQLAGGTVIMESLFGLPGMGTLLLEAIALRDYPVVQGVNLVLAVIVVLMNLCIDLTYGLVDPRLRYP